MTEKFIERHCKKCEFCIYEIDRGKKHPIGCGEIDDEGGCYHEPLQEMPLGYCKKGYKK